MLNRSEFSSILSSLKEQNQTRIQLIIEELHPYDIAQIFFLLSDEQKCQFLSCLKPEDIAHLLEEVEIEDRKEIFIYIDQKRSKQILSEMSSDDLTDLLRELDSSQRENLLTELGQKEAENVRILLHYPEDTAGGLMTTELIRIPSDLTVEEAIMKLRNEAANAETIYYVYVIDSVGHLVGVVSLRDLLTASPDSSIQHIMHERVISAHVDLDQEEVARLFTRYDFLALPVVDHKHYLLGIVTVDDIIDVLIEEAQEDISHLSASGIPDQALFISPFRSAKKRIPWLILLLFIGLGTANLIHLFHETIEILPILTVFMPMIAGMTGNTATQSLATVIRGLSSDKLTKKNYQRLIRQEGFVALIIGIICSIVILIFISITYGSKLGLLISLCLLCTLVIGTLVGTIIPLILHMFHLDPTVASGPLISTLNDVVSLMIYFGLASLFVHLIV